MKSMYEVTTKWTNKDGTNHNCAKYNTVANNMKTAIRQTEAHLKKVGAGSERVDSVCFVAEINF